MATNMEALWKKLCFISVIFSGACSEIPVLMWSSQLLADLASPLAGHTVLSDNFKTDFLSKLTCKECARHTLVAFLQDQLSLDDITRYGNVHTESSSGGSLPHIKDFMGRLSSMTLSSVKSPSEALENLKKSFPGNVHHLKAGESLKNLKLGGRNLVLYQLPTAGSTADNLKKNDAHISGVIKELSNRGIPYTAIYTGKHSSHVDDEMTRNMGRHLLAVKADSIAVNVSGCLFYAQKISLSASVNSTNTVLSNNVKTDGSTFTNSTRILKLTWGKEGGLTKVVTEIHFAQANGYWTVANMTLTAQGKINNTDINVENVNLNVKNIAAPLRYSYHCYPTTTFLHERNKTATGISLLIKGLQIQPDTKKNRFGPANDCVGFFTIGIWCGLIVAFVMLAILTYGIAMIANISTQDRFDDPKGKPLNVHVPEQDK